MQCSGIDRARRRVLRAGLAGALVVSAGLAACTKEAPSFNSTDMTGADIGKDWALPDLDGNLRSAKDYAGKVAVVFFGFIQCPDVCPTTLAQLAQVKQLLGDDGARMQALFVTVDPERDTPEVIRQYLAQFDPSFVGLRGDLEQTTAAAKTFKAFFAKAPIDPPGNYTMEHSSGLYLFDTNGAIRLYARHGQTPEQLAADIRQLLQ